MGEIDREIDRLELIDANRRLRNIEREQFLADPDEKDLTAFRLAHIGENAARLSIDIHDRYPQLPWTKMRALRNLVSYQYAVIDAQRIWQTATEDLSELRAACLVELKRREP